MRTLRWLWHGLERNFLPLIFIGMWVLVMLFINFNRQVADNAKAAKDTADATHQVVTKQDETLDAIKQLATDNKLNSKQLGDTIICMLQVPIAQRTIDVREQCRKQAETGIVPAPSTSQINTSQNTTSHNSQNTNSNIKQEGQGQNLGQKTLNILEAPGRAIGRILGL